MSRTNPPKPPIELTEEEFRAIGHQLIDELAHLFSSFDERDVTVDMERSELQQILGQDKLPEQGTQAAALLSRATELLVRYSLFNGHPKFMGYITSSPAPIGVLADLLASGINPNVGAHILSPIASEIERQTIKWLAELIGVPSTYGGILVSGGNMANFTAFLAARNAKAPDRIKQEGLSAFELRPTFYCSETTHTWIDKAVDLFGFGAESVRWIKADDTRRMNNQKLMEAIEADLKAGYKPLTVIGTAGDVSTGVVDDLQGISAICKEYDMWFHIDGAYGVPASALPEYNELFKGITEADSIALDPHKWLYSPLEAGCTLVKDPRHLIHTYSSHPSYYNFGNNEEELSANFYEYGFQNSRGFRALKVWMSLQHVGRDGYTEMIRKDIELARYLFELADKNQELEAITQHLSITTFRFVPSDKDRENDYLNTLNERILNMIQASGKVFLSNAVVDEKYCLRACIVNFRTTPKDIEEVIEFVLQIGKETHKEQLSNNHQ